MPDWNTRLVVTVGTTVVTPIDSFVPTISMPRTMIHSIEADNVGAISQPRTATFTMSLKAIGASAAMLTDLAINRTKFNIQLGVQSGNDWSFKKLLFRDCLITTANPSNTTPDGAPVATFNGVILGFGEASDIEKA